MTKGAVIGAGVGGAAGAIINKRNRVVGGVIGGVAGGVAGYAIGKHIDNKQKARIEAENRARVAAEAAENRELASAAKPSVMHVPVVAVNAAAVTQPQAVTMAAVASAEPVPSTQLANVLFLPNNSYGDPSTPYPTSEYRRKSW